MRQKLHPPIIELLPIRLSISRNLKVFKVDDLALNWGTSSRTLLRYTSPRDRRISREVARRATERGKLRDKALCRLCPLKLLNHPRCKSCTMLLHGKPECDCVALT